MDDQSNGSDRENYMDLKLHFCNDPTGWRYLIPTLINLPESQFQWEICRFPPGLTQAHILLKSSTFSYVPPRCEEYVAEWLDIYCLEELSSKVELYWWGLSELTIESTQLSPLKPEHNGFILDLVSRYPQMSLRALLVKRGLGQTDRLKLYQVLSTSKQTLEQLEWNIPELPTWSKLNLRSILS
jgi:hypothetical protein